MTTRSFRYSLLTIFRKPKRQPKGSSSLNDDGTIELKETIGDIKAQAHLGLYYSSKIRGAVELARYRKSNDQEKQRAAVTHLELALIHWQNYASALDAQYIKMVICFNGLFVSVLNLPPGVGRLGRWERRRSGDFIGFCLCPALGGDAGGRERGGLVWGRVLRQAFDDFDEVVLWIEVLAAAIGQKGVDDGVVGPGFEAGRVRWGRAS